MINHLYVHVPFCKSICYYCDFCHRIYDNVFVTKWLDTLEKEIKETCKDQYQTIYIGGGTPNCLTYNQLNKLLSLIKPYTNRVIEYTIELNPESFSIEQLLLFKKYGINRFSIGLQTSNNELLSSLNRKHSYEDAIKTIKILKAYNFHNISIDLMYSLPNQTIDILNKTLDDILLLDVPHISIYSLTIEKNSVFGKTNTQKLDDEIEADMYNLIVDKLTSNGYTHYEVSNFAKEGYESKHNLGYWNYDDYLGISMSSSSKIQCIRYTNTKSFDNYFKSYNNKEEYLELTKKDLIIENIMMSLRTNIGLSIDSFNKLYNIDFYSVFNNSIIKFKDSLIISNNRIICSNLAILNHILTYFYLDLDTYFDK